MFWSALCWPAALPCAGQLPVAATPCAVCPYAVYNAGGSPTHDSFYALLIMFSCRPYYKSGSAVGLQDPGNWATDLEGGAQFGYTLLVVVLLSNMLAIFLQSLSLRLGIVSERDLAQACRDAYPKARPSSSPAPGGEECTVGAVFSAERG